MTVGAHASAGQTGVDADAAAVIGSLRLAPLVERNNLRLKGRCICGPGQPAESIGYKNCCSTRSGRSVRFACFTRAAAVDWPMANGGRIFAAMLLSSNVLNQTVAKPRRSSSWRVSRVIE